MSLHLIAFRVCVKSTVTCVEKHGWRTYTRLIFVEKREHLIRSRFIPDNSIRKPLSDKARPLESFSTYFGPLHVMLGLKPLAQCVILTIIRRVVLPRTLVGLPKMQIITTITMTVIKMPHTQKELLGNIQQKYCPDLRHWKHRM